MSQERGKGAAAVGQGQRQARGLCIRYSLRLSAQRNCSHHLSAARVHCSTPPKDTLNSEQLVSVSVSRAADVCVCVRSIRASHVCVCVWVSGCLCLCLEHLMCVSVCGAGDGGGGRGAREDARGRPRRLPPPAPPLRTRP
eukprot:3614093-Rhodomonas_salina.1